MSATAPNPATASTAASLAAARENSRRSNGQFGHYARPKASQASLRLLEVPAPASQPDAESTDVAESPEQAARAELARLLAEPAPQPVRSQPSFSADRGVDAETLMAVVYVAQAMEQRTFDDEDLRARFAPTMPRATFDIHATEIDRRLDDLEHIHAVQAEFATAASQGRTGRLDDQTHEIARFLGMDSHEDFTSDEEFLAEAEASAANEAAESIIRLIDAESRAREERAFA